MIVPPSPARLLGLVRSRYILLLSGGAVVSLGATIVGLTAPYLYRSEVILKFSPSTAQVSPTSKDSIRTLAGRAAALTRSPEALGKVAEEVTKDGSVDLAVIAPQSIPSFNLKYRLGLLLSSLGGKPPSALEHSISSRSLAPEILADLLDQNLTFNNDVQLHTLRISYEAGDPVVAQRVCRQISESYIAVSVGLAKEELRRQESNLNSAIKQQQENIDGIEAKMHKILERYPEIMASKGDPSGSLLGAQQLVQKQDRLRRLEAELHANNLLLGAMKAELSPSKELDHYTAGDLIERVADKISELEVQLFKDVKVAGYSEDHPKVTALQQKIAVLTELFNASNTIGLGEGDTLKESYRLRIEVQDRSRRQKLEYKALANELLEQNAVFKDVLKESYTFMSYVRELDIQVTLKNTLHQELQRIRMIIGGATPFVGVLAPATLELHPINVSVRKRTVFGFFVGFALVLSFLLILDLVRPVLLSLEDLLVLNIKHFGQFRMGERCVSQIAHCLLSLRHKDVVIPVKDREGGVAVFFSLAVQPSFFETLFHQLVGELTKHGKKVGVIHIGDGSSNPECAVDKPVLGSVERVWLAADSVPSQFASTARHLRTQCDWILVDGSRSSSSPVAAFVGKNADYFFFVTKNGKSELKSMKRLTQDPGSREKLQHYALVF